ncbi:hypothetical protein Csa_009767 [Cucumis sativus]|uniref:Uncharacterized protein n=1 Tax=Cucumis sativus TaxID=3659 RepID=A0A0A0L5C1_CUCSA|nr:hypothetical protein Csa_009767 [Cucumis sativus]
MTDFMQNYLYYSKGKSKSKPFLYCHGNWDGDATKLQRLAELWRASLCLEIQTQHAATSGVLDSGTM